MPSTKCIYEKEYVLLNLVYMCCVRAFTLQFTSTQSAVCRSFVVLPQSASEATRIVIKYQLCVKINSCVFNCKPDNKNRNPENL